MCANCLKSQVDITSGISKQLTVFYCRNCGRYQRPPWQSLELESREMLAFLLKKVKGLTREVRLVDAAFVWTEPHSKRIKLRLTVQSEVFSSAILQQSFVVEFVIAGQQCTDCQRSFTEHTWTAVVQVRQKAQHKKTMLMLEQLMLKHNAVSRAMGVKEQPDGLDFYFHSRGGAAHLLDFLRSVVPIRSRLSKRLISQDDSSNTYNYKYTMYAEVAPVCKDDLVLLEPKLLQTLGLGGGGGAGRVFIVTRVTSNITLLDPVSLKMVEVSGGTYWHYPFRAIMTARQLTEYMIIGKEEEQETEDGRSAAAARRAAEGGKKDSKRQPSRSSSRDPSHRSVSRDGRAFSKATIPALHKLKLARFTLMKTAEMGVVDNTYDCVSHLGHLLHVGDHCLGYDFNNANTAADEEQQGGSGASSSQADVIIVKKSYDKKNRAKKRKFVLKTLVKEEADSASAAGGRAGRRGDERRNSVDMEEFMQEIEEDQELAGKVNLYKRKDLPAAAKGRGGAGGAAGQQQRAGEDEEEEEGDVPEVDMDALLEEMGSMQVTVGGGDGGQSESEADDDRGEFEGDWEVGGAGQEAAGGRKSAAAAGGVNGKRSRR